MCLTICLLGQFTGLAQSGRPTRNGWATALSRQYRTLYKQTSRLARRHNWSLSKNYANGRVFRLYAVDSLGQPVYYSLHNDEAARATQTNALNGNGVLPVALSGNSAFMAGKLGIWDGGRVLNTHQEFGPSRIQQRDGTPDLSDHTTHLAGTLVAQGVNARARGMAFGGQLSVWDYANDLVELTSAASDLLISNHAYGPVTGWVYNPTRPGTDPNLKWEWWGNPKINSTEDYLYGFYTATARDLDRIAYNNPYFLMVRSADNKRSETGPPADTPYFLRNTDQTSTQLRSRNDSYDVIPADATAKNVLTVGAADVRLSGQQPELVGSTSFSGWGPTDDGRIKPDLLGMGSSVFSTVSTGTTDYATMTGTSMASANVSGALFLLQELYAQQSAQQGRVTGQFMRAATLRGLALHTAIRSDPANGPDYRQGWGLLNANAAARVILNTDKAHLLLESSLTPGRTVNQAIVAQGNEPLIITLCWTDPEGTASPTTTASVNSRTPKLVNDLDLRVDDGSSASLPFVLDPNRPDQPATQGDNVRDNVEQVYIANPVPGKAYSINVSHKGHMTYNSQPFSVIVSGLRRASNCQPAARITPTGQQWLCDGQPPVTLTATASANAQIDWLLDGQVISGTHSTTLSASVSGRYQIRVKQGDCESLSAETVFQSSTVNSIDVTPIETELILPQGATLTLRAPVETDYRYQWYRNDSLLARATTYELPVAQTGRYKVRVEQQTCAGWSSERVVLSNVLTSTTNGPDPAFVLFPNPAETTLTVRFNHSTARQVSATIFDVDGRVRLRVLLPKNNLGRFEGNLPVTDLPSGAYVLHLTGDFDTQTSRFIKK
ncbi:S8 family peptidase [Spirosoma montaniterrae]|uniref:Peptidase S8 n=1 Tax=Spirosoma montaniterrae TaxID=1178516 RepID=A0A1P9X2Q3_9BACT|nr:S8 family peptidase [Spirosoma montaniterrae]AQG81883.1 hypothetical protein AWR27_22835 [Spirosoma montaniterrae]